MKQSASALAVERTAERSRVKGRCVIPAQAGIQKRNNWPAAFAGMTYKGALYCHFRESGNPESIPEFPLAQQEHRSRHKAAWIPACAGMTHQLLHSAKMFPKIRQTHPRRNLIPRSIRTMNRTAKIKPVHKIRKRILEFASPPAPHSPG